MSSDLFAPLFGKSPTHRDWQHYNWCLIHLASFLSEFDRSVNDSLFSPPVPSENKKTTLERVVELYLSFLMYTVMGNKFHIFKYFLTSVSSSSPLTQNSQHDWETLMLRTDFFPPSEGVVMTVATSLSVDLSKY